MQSPKIPLILALCTASVFSLSCSTTKPEPVSAAQANATEEPLDTEPEINTWSRVEEETLEDLCKFGHRHEVQGDLRDARWADLKPTLSDSSAITVPPSQDISKALEASLHLECSQAESIEETSAVMIFCSKPNQIRQYEGIGKIEELSPGFYCTSEGYRHKNDCGDCPHEMADVVYLGLTNPKDKSTIFHPIAKDLDFGLIFGECSSYGIDNDFSIVDVQVKPFMDTTGVYVRTRWNKKHFTDHTGHGSFDRSLTYTTWLFAGDEYRLVASWDDTVYTYEIDESVVEVEKDESIDCIECGDSCDASCFEAPSYAETEETQNYTENYLYYESGKFSIKSRSANSFETLKELVSKRP